MDTDDDLYDMFMWSSPAPQAAQPSSSQQHNHNQPGKASVTRDPNLHILYNSDPSREAQIDFENLCRDLEAVPPDHDGKYRRPQSGFDASTLLTTSACRQTCSRSQGRPRSQQWPFPGTFQTGGLLASLWWTRLPRTGRYPFPHHRPLRGPNSPERGRPLLQSRTWLCSGVRPYPGARAPPVLPLGQLYVPIPAVQWSPQQGHVLERRPVGLRRLSGHDGHLDT